MSRFMIGLAIVLALLAAPAHAQKRGSAPPTPPEDLDKKLHQEAVDQQYRSTLKRTKSDNAPTYVDPWANTRGPNNSKR